MVPNNLHIEDLLQDDSFISYCRRSSAEDILYWTDFKNQSAANELLVKNAADMYHQLFNTLAEMDLEVQTNQLQVAIDGLSKSPVVPINHSTLKNNIPTFLSRFKIAAVVLLILGVAGYLIYSKNGKSEAVTTYVAQPGEKKSLQLPDGSLVTLNAGSSIEINQDFGIASRNIDLKGEAFFEVKHNEQLPFIVRTPAMDVKALGTVFNVKAYQNEPVTEATLLNGVVEVTLKEDNNSKSLLYPNEKIKWKRLGSGTAERSAAENATDQQTAHSTNRSVKEPVVKMNNGTIKEVAWKADELVFDEERFDEIALLLERRYDIKVDFKDQAVQQYRFTGVFEKEELGTVLDFLKESKPFNYSMEEGTPTILHLSK